MAVNMNKGLEVLFSNMVDFILQKLNQWNTPWGSNLFAVSNKYYCVYPV